MLCNDTQKGTQWWENYVETSSSDETNENCTEEEEECFMKTQMTGMTPKLISHIEWYAIEVPQMLYKRSEEHSSDAACRTPDTLSSDTLQHLFAFRV